MVQAAEAPLETAFRDYYDPNCTRDNLAELLDYLKVVKQPDQATDLGQTCVGGVLAAESTHARFLTADPDRIGEFAELVGTPTAIVSEAVDREQRIARVAAQAVMATIPEVRFNIAIPGVRTKYPDHSQLSMAGILLMTKGHIRTPDRKSGRPYISHPAGLATMLDIVNHRHKVFSPDEQDKQTFDLMVHDTWEEAFRRDNGIYFPPNDFVVSPLVVENVLDMLEVPEAAEMAETQYLLTRQLGPDGAMEFNRYIDRGIPYLRFNLRKLIDTKYNWQIEPNIAEVEDDNILGAIERRNLRYSNATLAMAQELKNRSSIDLGLLVESIGTLTMKDIQTGRSYRLPGGKAAETGAVRILDAHFQQLLAEAAATESLSDTA